MSGPLGATGSPGPESLPAAALALLGSPSSSVRPQHDPDPSPTQGRVSGTPLAGGPRRAACGGLTGLPAAPSRALLSPGPRLTPSELRGLTGQALSPLGDPGQPWVPRLSCPPALPRPPNPPTPAQGPRAVRPPGSDGPPPAADTPPRCPRLLRCCCPPAPAPTNL